MIKNLLKNALFGLIVCTAIGGGVGSAMHANVGPVGGGETSVTTDNSGQGGNNGTSGETPKCILTLSTCPISNPTCGTPPAQISVSCLDPSCTKGICTPVSGGSGQSGKSTTNGTSGTNGPSDSCMIRHFECAKGAGASCYQRWHSMAVSCGSSACTSDATCIKADTFFSTYSLQPWDLGQLTGPFPRTEMMCAIQQSSCSPNDANCVSPVSIQQIPCDDTRCQAGACTRSSILVDQTDSIVSTTTSTNGNGNSGKGNSVSIDGNPSGTVSTDGNTTKGSDKQGGGTNGNSNNNANGGNQDTTANSGNGNTATTNNSGPGKSTDNGTVTISTPVETLGCFDTTGKWTIDRSQCASDQQQFVNPTATTQTTAPVDPVAQKHIEQTIETKFIPDTRKNTLVQNLLSSTVEATGRLDTLLSNPDLPDNLKQQAQTTLDTLKNVQNNAASPDLTVRDIQGLADNVSTQLVSVQKAASTWKQKRDVPVSVTDKLDNIFKTLPAIFQLLQQSNIPLDSSITNQYGVAAQIYVTVHGTCTANADTCGDLSKVFDALEPLVNGIKTTLDTANRPDLEQQIDQMLQ